MEVGYNLAKKINDANPQSTKMVYIALKGEMGVGKTAFTIGFSSFYGIKGVKSPTYTVMNEYRSERGKRLYHFDMYRISGEDDLYSIGYDDYLDSDAVIIVEWSENILQFIPEDAIFVTIERCSDSEAKRKITIQSPDFD
jgi:tRNA threonylcarbamoyladenosine biosynthesis protein TsaE